MKKAYDYFCEFVRDNERYPTLEEWYQLGYKRASYYQCKKDYKPTEPEEAGYAVRTKVEQYENGVSVIDLKF